MARAVVDAELVAAASGLAVVGVSLPCQVSLHAAAALESDSAVAFVTAANSRSDRRMSRASLRFLVPLRL